jgi:hypothetical protein
MDDETFSRLQRLSTGLTGNNTTLPTAAAVAALQGQGAISAPDVVKDLGGRLPANRAGKALTRLAQLGVMREFPYPGPPHPRLYELIPGPFWDFVRDWAMDPKVDHVET